MISEDFALDLHTYLIVSGGALLAYDYALTFSMEVERFWVSHQASITTTLYFVNRYAGLVGYIPVLYQFLGENNEDGYGVLYAYLVMASMAALMVIRVYALYNRDSVVLRMLGTHLSLGIILCGALRWVGIFGIEIIPEKALTASRCVPYRSDKQGKALAAVWSLKPLFDLMLLLLTVWKSFKFKQTPRPVLIDILIADGILYFAASLVLNILSICFCLWTPPYLRGVGTPVTAVICSIMASRMTLNLRDPDIIPHPTESPSDSTPEPEHFVSTILSLGHPSYAESLRSRSEVGNGMVPFRRAGSQGMD